jgi:uncharacterized protein (DUF342 family)
MADLNLTFIPQLFSQNKDSLAQMQEMQREKRFGDSLHQAQLARDSAFQELMDESAQKLNQSIAASKQKEVEEATNQVMALREKEQKSKRKTMYMLRISVTTK